MTFTNHLLNAVNVAVFSQEGFGKFSPKKGLSFVVEAADARDL